MLIRLSSLLLIAAAVLAAQPYQPTWESLDSRPSLLKSVTLLGASAPLNWKARNGSVVIDLPEMPEDLMKQPAWVLKLRK
jgi:Alpha-L-fucosidase C-terminal domain